MTSKEFIQDEIDNLEDILENARKDNCNIVVKECEKDIKHYNQVLKDLEILEEIRNTFKVEKEETINQNHYWLIVKKKPYYSYMITKEQYDKWNRWLENDNVRERILP